MGLTSKNINAKPTLEISIDDGWHDDILVAYYLEKHGARATFYVVCDWIGQPGYMTWEQIQVLDKAGHTIGSHTMSHPQDLKILHDEQLHYEVQNSKDILEAALGHKVEQFCYPRGRTDERVSRFVAEAGYLEARITGNPSTLDYIDKLAKPGNWHMFQRQEYGAVHWEDWGDHLMRQGARYINLWGHSKEMTEHKIWDTFDKVLSNLKSKQLI